MSYTKNQTIVHATRKQPIVVALPLKKYLPKSTSTCFFQPSSTQIPPLKHKQSNLDNERKLPPFSELYSKKI